MAIQLEKVMSKDGDSGELSEYHQPGPELRWVYRQRQTGILERVSVNWIFRKRRLLAAITKSSERNTTRSSIRMRTKTRRALVLKNMLDQGYILRERV